jgi:restriction endonuclease Mrr
MWAMTHMEKACLLEYVRRGTAIITERGLKILSVGYDAIDMRTLPHIVKHFLIEKSNFGVLTKAAAVRRYIVARANSDNNKHRCLHNQTSVFIAYFMS